MQWLQGLITMQSKKQLLNAVNILVFPSIPFTKFSFSNLHCLRSIGWSTSLKSIQNVCKWAILVYQIVDKLICEQYLLVGLCANGSLALHKFKAICLSVSTGWASNGISCWHITKPFIVSRSGWAKYVQDRYSKVFNCLVYTLLKSIVQVNNQSDLFCATRTGYYAVLKAVKCRVNILVFLSMLV